MNDTNTVLVGTGSSGNFVHNNQTMGTQNDFRNVSQKWLDRGCMTFDRAMEVLAEGRAQTEDIMATTRQMTPTVNDNGEFVMKYQDGREFKPNLYAVEQMADWAKCGTWFATSLMANPENRKGQQLFARDREDADTLATVFKNGFRRVEESKPFLWRTRKDGTMRAMLTDSYAIINNEWFMDSLKKLVPGGLVSHWRGDDDSIYGNILIPDSIREEKDSDYGGMLSIGNSEIGRRRLYSRPSVFRAICQNGCIWDQTKGYQIEVRHRGDIDLEELFGRLKQNLESQIPLLPRGIDLLLGTRKMGWAGDSVLPIFAQASNEFKLTKKQTTMILEGYYEEVNVNHSASKTLFGLINGITRASQKMTPGDWVHLDTIGGVLSNYDPVDWGRFTGRAKTLNFKEVNEAFMANAQ